jgi:hypothetical protein
MKKPSSPPWASSRPGRMRTQPSARGVTPSGSSGLRRIEREIGIAARKAATTLLAFLRLERADRIDQLAAGLQPVAARSSSAPEARRSAMIAGGRGRALRDGGGRCRSPSRARRAGSRRTAAAGFQSSASAATSFALSRCARDSRAVGQTTFATVERGHSWPAAASCMVLPPGAAHRSSTSRHRRDQPRGKRGGEVLDPPAALAEAGKFGDRELSRRTWRGASERAAVRGA